MSSRYYLRQHSASQIKKNTVKQRRFPLRERFCVLFCDLSTLSSIRIRLPVFLPVLNLPDQDIWRVALLRTAPHAPCCTSSSSALLLFLLLHQLPSASSHTSSHKLPLFCPCSFHFIFNTTSSSG